ncbi:MAG: serine/threonine-protein kinase [Gaiellaceae bacterium]
MAIASQALPKRYSSATLIARGGMGEVYRATDTVLERKVAVKLLSQRHASEPEVRARFRREALAAARLSGTPHLITVFDVGEYRKQPYLVMEFLDGGSVDDRLREGPVPPGQALEWLAQAGQALDRAHAQGVVHRDVKPANLLLDRHGSICVTDFGIASTTGFDTLTLPGTVLGTAGYLSPEQARGEPATAASDRYGLGVVAFELLTGRRPFEGETAATEALAHVTAPVPSAERLQPGLPDGVDEVLERALAKDPRARPATCAELVADLRDAFTNAAAAPTVVAPGASTVPTRTTHRSSPRLHPKLLLAAGLLLLAGLAGAALLGALRDDASEQGASAPAAPTTPATPSETTSPPTTSARTDGSALNDEGFALMQQGDFERALPLLARAVQALRRSGSLTEAYASYNLAYTRFALERCDGVLGLLDRSERIQGERRDIDALRRDWEQRCAAGAGDDDDAGTGKGKGRGRGKGNGD